MKVTSLIIALIFVWMIFLPCDEALGSELCCEEIHLHQQGDNEHGDHSEEDNCSPLCSCVCCHNFTIDPTSTAPSFHLIDSDTQIFHLQYFGSTTLLSIWKPPQQT